MAKINLEPYKGVRDFYPEDKAAQNYIFEIWKKSCEKFGYVQYDASVLEPLDLYRAKSSEEIVNEQIYSFTDRGDREVALRPEMTPTVARMVAAKWQEIPAPARWFSIPNLFRYEKPQRGRLREHWQLNADIFGISHTAADTEIISLAACIMKEFGASSKDYIIKINSRKVMNDLYQKIGITSTESQKVSRLIDKKEKISKEDFDEALIEIIGEEKRNKLTYVLDSEASFFDQFKETESVIELKEVLESLKKGNIENIVFSPTLVRGFDYYTGIIFEVFDTNSENPRSLFGGGRYDNLIGDFTGEKVPAVGFGMGDVTIKDFLDTHDLFPTLSSTTDLWVCIALETSLEKIEALAFLLREKGLRVGLDISGKKLPDQLKSIEKRNIPFLMVVGEEELEKQIFKVRNTKTREEKEGSLEEVITFIQTPHA